MILTPLELISRKGFAKTTFARERRAHARTGISKEDPRHNLQPLRVGASKSRLSA